MSRRTLLNSASLVFLAALIFAAPARAQTVSFPSAAGTPGGSSGQIEYNNSGAFGGFTLAGDCTLSQPNITCTKTGGTSFTSAATTAIGTSGATIPLLNAANTYSGASTYSGAVTNSGASAASTPAMLYTGAIFTGGTGTTTFPHFLIQPTGSPASSGWSTSGTALGINVANTFAGNLIDVKVNGAANSGMTLDANGTMNVGGQVRAQSNVTAGANGVTTATISFTSGSALCSPTTLIWEMGGCDVTGSPTAQVLSGQGIKTTSNTAGGSLTLRGGLGTGTATSGAVNLAVGVAGSTGATANAVVNALTADGKVHVSYGGTAPAISSCGTSPSAVTGNDTSGSFTTGTGTPSACTITFNLTYTAAPNCLVVDSTALANLTSYTVSTSAIVLTTAAASSQVIRYQCFGA